MGTIGGAATWRPSDLILRDIFCPHSEIQTLADELRIRVGASWLVALSYDKHNVVPVLSFISTNGSNDHAKVGQKVRSLTTQPVVNRLTGNEQEIIRWSRSVELFPPDDDLYVLRSNANAISSHGLQICVFADADLQRGFQEEVAELATYINATELAAIRKQQSLTRTIRRVTAAEEDASRTATLVRVAVQHLSADCAIFYSIDRDPTKLQADCDYPTGSRELVTDLPEDIQLSDGIRGITNPKVRSIIQAFIQSASFIHPLTPQSGSAISTTVSSIAVPVPYGDPDRPKSLNLGVLIVLTDSKRPFSRLNLTSLQIFALRLSLLYRLEQIDESSHQLAVVADMLSKLGEPDESLSVAKPLTLGARAFPADYEQSRLILESLADHLLKATPSASVSIRLISTSQPAEASILVCRRFTARPAERMSDPEAIIPIFGQDAAGRHHENTSANVRAVITGKTTLYPSDEIKLIREITGRNTLSEVAVPIVCGSHIVGTVNVESPLAEAYVGEVVSIVESFAALAGVAIALGREQVLARVARRAAIERIGPHEIDNARTAVNAIREAIDGDDTDLGQKVSYLAALVDRYDLARSSEAPSTAEKMSEIIKHSVNSVLVPANVDFRLGIVDDCLIDEQSSHEVHSVMDEIMRNVTRHSAPGVAIIQTTGVKLGGLNYVHISFKNPAKKRLLSSHTAKVYRVPVVSTTNDNDRPRLGCYMVGEMVREMGGDIFMRFVPDPDMVQTHWFVPVGE
ncbi:GAF domain-containing protein [Mycobacterium sp. NPDC048908]|uniref:GAF domain-containing protein n=1 Tax=Mycobacterium sp. NPDC048908 TaxID=3364292 RepID=UPI00370F7ECB